MLKLGGSAVMAAALAGCGGNANNAGTEAASDDVKQLTFEPGKLTVATGNPAWEPWVMNDDPESGEGFEAAVIYALAEKMGFAKEDVVWVRTTFDEAFAPGEHTEGDGYLYQHREAWDTVVFPNGKTNAVDSVYIQYVN